MNEFIKKLKETSGDDLNKITFYKLLVFFIPLGTSTFLISISNMLLNRCLGYIPNSEFYISSFSVARTLMLLFMSPVSIIALVVTTFTQNKNTFKKVTKFALITITLLQIWFFVLSFTDISRNILSSMYNLDGRLLDNAVLSLKTICILPIFFFARNFFLGISIKLRNIKFATIGSFLRVLLILIFSFIMPSVLRAFRAEYVPGILLFGMIFLESLVYVLGVLITTKGKVLLHLLNSMRTQNILSIDDSLNYKKILYFSLPLILSYSMGQLLPSFSQSALALGENKEIILTVYSISLSLLNIIGSFSFQIPQLVVNHDTFNPINKNKVRNFCFFVAGTMTVFMLLLSFTVIGDFSLANIMKVSQNNISIAKLSLIFGILYPASTVFMAYKRGKLIKIQKTTLLVFERVIGTLISLVLFLIVPIVAWQYGSAAGILTLTAANFATGLFTHIVFKISTKRKPEIITYS